MLSTNPFSELPAVITPDIMQGYVILMVLAVIIGTILDMLHKKSAQYFFENSRKAKKDAKVGDMIEQFVEVKTFGRVAAQTAKQVIMQRLREAEREIVMAEYECTHSIGSNPVDRHRSCWSSRQIVLGPHRRSRFDVNSRTRPAVRLWN